MRCCVPGCKNDSKHLSKSQGITFHAFPTIPEVRQSWIKALGKKNWQPKERSAVCSNHFYYEDLYITKSGLRKVRSGAVPFVTGAFRPTYSIEDEKPLLVCRLCLVTTNQCYSIKDNNFEQIIENLTGIMASEDVRLPQVLCNVCTHRLNKYNEFRQTTLQANNVLVDLISKHDFITPALINTENNLSYLKKFSIKILQEYDFDIEHTENIKSEQELEIQNQVDINKDEITLDIDNIDSAIDNSLNDQNIQNVDNIQMENTENQNQEIFANDIKLYYSDSDNYKSDFDSEDSLPLITKKKKKKVLKTEVKIDRRKKPFLNSDLNETLFDIEDLSYEEQIAEIEKRQESDNYKHAVFKCNECYKGFLDQAAYNSHMVRHTTECGDHRCSICKTHFKHPHALRKHITAHHTQRFTCKQCSYVTMHRQTARLHERWHRGTKYTCPHCPEEFVKFTTYMGHIRIKHPSDFVCGLCGYSFVSAKGIQMHKKLKHRSEVEIPADGPYCEPCDVRFANEEAYQKHLSISNRHEHKTRDDTNTRKRRTKNREREKSSKDAEETDDEKSRLYANQMRKSEGPIPCEQCGVQLEDSRAYHGHFRRMHPDKNRTKYPSMRSPCMCEVCGRIFQSYSLLKDHRWVHTGERPFKCDQCDKSFRMRQRLVAHRHVHSARKHNYLCNVCGKHFTTQSNRQRHLSIHTGLKPFKCEMCGKAFKHVSEKRSHITYVHLKKPWPKRSRGKRREGRQGSVPPQPVPQDMDIPMWPCDPKLTDLNNIIEDKPIYYNIKL